MTELDDAHLSDLNDLDAVCAALGIQDSHVTPAEAVRRLQSDLEDHMQLCGRLATALEAIVQATDEARAALGEFASFYANPTR